MSRRSVLLAITLCFALVCATEIQKPSVESVQAGGVSEERPILVEEDAKFVDDNKWIDKLVDKVKKGKTDAFGGAKATVLSNSNVLNHKEADKSGDFEARIKRTKEEGHKSKAEDLKKQQMEKRQKRLEDKTKVNVQKKKRQLRESNKKLEAEQDKKTAHEAKTKAKEAGRKRRFEKRTKRTVAAAQKKAKEAQKKATKKLAEQRKKESRNKSRLEKKQKSMIRETHHKSESKRKRARQEIKHKKHLEHVRKERRTKRENRAKQNKRRKEKRRKVRRRRATGRWCRSGCRNVRVNFRARNQWLNCPSGTLITGIYRGRYQNLANIYYYRCCSPCKDKGRKRMSVSSCTTANWWRSFDRAGWSYCKGNTYMQGVYKGGCNWIYCLEMARCCYISGSRGRKACKAKGSWGRSFDRAGWSYLSTNKFMIGLYRSSGHYLYNIEYPNECSYYAYS